MNRKPAFARTLGFFLMTFAFFGMLSAQPGTEPTASDSLENSEEQMEDEPVVIVKSDTTEVVWRDKKFIIISEDGVKRVDIVDVPQAKKGKDSDDESSDGFDPEYDNKDKKKKKNYSSVDPLGLDLGILNYYGPSGFAENAIPTAQELEVRDFRIGSHVALHLLPTTVSLIGRGAVNLKSAITIDWSSHYFKGDVTLVEGENGLELENTGVEFEKNKLTTRYAQIPLLLNFNTDPGGDDGVSISVGGYAGILWNARTKQVSNQNGTVKKDGEFGVNRYRYGLMARVDFKWFDFYVMYNLSPLFESENPSDTQTVMAGVNLINF